MEGARGRARGRGRGRGRGWGDNQHEPRRPGEVPENVVMDRAPQLAAAVAQLTIEPEVQHTVSNATQAVIAFAETQSRTRVGEGINQEASVPFNGGLSEHADRGFPVNGQMITAGRGRLLEEQLGAVGGIRPQPARLQAEVVHQVENNRQVDRTLNANRRRRDVLYVAPRLCPDGISLTRSTYGRQVELLTNTFGVNVDEQFHLYQYSVDFLPDVPNVEMRRQLMNDHRAVFGPAFVFDRTLLFCAVRLDLDEVELTSVHPTVEQTIRIIVRFRCELMTTSPDYYAFRNRIFRRVLRAIGLQLINRDLVDPNQRVTIPEYGLEVWPGYDSSIFHFEAGPMLLVDVMHKVISVRTVYEVLTGLRRNRQEQREYREECRQHIVGQIVMTRYNNRTYRVDDIDWDRNPQSKFQLQSGMEISFIDYYQRHYREGGRIVDDRQPLLVSRPTARDRRGGRDNVVYLVPELCFTTGLSEQMRTDFRVMTALAEHTRPKAAARIRRLMDMRRLIEQNDEARKLLSDWRMNITPELQTVAGRVMPPETLFQANGQSYTYNGEKGDWSNEMRGIPLLTPKPLDDWLCVFPERNRQTTVEFINALRRVCNPMGMQFNEPQLVPLQGDRPDSYTNELQRRLTPTTKIVLCVLPNNRKDRYDSLKLLLSVDKAVPSQMMLTKTMTKPGLSVATKVALQMNSKMAGELWRLDIPLKDTMIVGIDTYHDTKRKGGSVAGFIATVNNTYTRYYSQCKLQGPGEELLVNICAFMTKAMRQYCDCNGGNLPKRIIVYRDGVGDGQIDHVRNVEISQIKAAFVGMEIEDQYRPKLTFIIVKKRISHRFFRPNGRQQCADPFPGTVIDSGVTRPEWFDFFLISQCVRQGTVTPTHYNIIWHESLNLTAEHIQRLTFKLCHLYPNCQCTIRVPAPCQLAHKLAYIVGESLHRDPHPRLADRLWYL